MSPVPPGRPPRTLWDQLPAGQAPGYDLAANVLVGVGLGWLLEHFKPGLHPWGLGGGLLVGAASGFYQLFSAGSRRKRPAGPRDERKDRDPT